MEQPYQQQGLQGEEHVDRLKLAVLVMELHPDATLEQLAHVLGLQRSFSALFWKVKAEEVLQHGQVVCEWCGEWFLATDLFYEQGVYAYCTKCCQW